MHPDVAQWLIAERQSEARGRAATARLAAPARPRRSVAVRAHVARVLVALARAIDPGMPRERAILRRPAL